MQQDRQSARLSGAHVRLFMAILLHNEAVFADFQGKLTVDHFSEESYRLLYRVMLDLFQDNAALPTSAEVWTELESHFEADSEIVSEESRLDLEEFLEFAYDPELFHDSPPTGKKMENFAFKVGKRLLWQYTQHKIEVTVRNAPSLDQLPFILQQHQAELDVIEMTSQKKQATLTMGPNWSKHRPMDIRSTGLGFLDRYMGGGAAAGEAYGFMAPYGTCKTTVAVMLWSCAAQQCYEDTLSENWDGRKGLSVLVTYEAPLAPEILHRLVMYSAQVSRYSLERMGMDGIDALGDDPDNPLPYEKERFKQQLTDVVFKTEKQRVAEIEPWVNAHTLCLDFSGSDPEHPTAGSGGIPEIVQRIRQELRLRGPEYYVRNVIVDYLGLMVDRDLAIKNAKKQAEDHKTYQQAGEQVVHQISKFFNCHTWLMHQLSGQANAKLSATATMHHTDAKGSKSFAENLNFAFVVGNLNIDGLGQITCTKHRRYRKLPATIIKVDGEFNLVLSPDNYQIDNRGNIVDKATASLVGNAPALNHGVFNDLDPPELPPMTTAAETTYEDTASYTD